MIFLWFTKKKEKGEVKSDSKRRAKWNKHRNNRKTTAFEIFPRSLRFSRRVKVAIWFYDNHFHGNLDDPFDELDDSHHKVNGL